METNDTNIFNYNPEWFDFGFIDSDFVKKQLSEYTKAKNSSLEHYKWAAYLYVIENCKFDSEEQRHNFLLLIENDPNPHLWKGAISELITRGVFDENWQQLMPTSTVFSWPLLQEKLAQNNSK